MHLRRIVGVLTATVFLTPASSSAAADLINGRLLFAQCQTCHSTDVKETLNGPTLKGLWGRKAGSVLSFKYSPAMKALDITWSEATLDKFLTKPTAMVPGTLMVYSGLPRAEDRADIIAWLKKEFAE
jgi:cytochrome c